MPRRWLDASRALELAGRAGLQYAVTADKVDGLVGPFVLDQPVSAAELASLAARAAGLDVSWTGGVAVLQPPAARGLSWALADLKSPDAAKRRRAAFALGESRRLEAVGPLSSVLADTDPSVRRTALLALAAFEGDFDRGQWRGRLSVFELPAVKAMLDVDCLLWIVEEAAPAGGEEWKAAVSVLSRAREGQLPRAIWREPWDRTAGATMPAIRAVGRCGDPGVRSMLEKRLRNTFTNSGADRYVSAASLGQLGMADSLIQHLIAEGRGAQPPEVRCAAAYGLGLCPGGESVVEALTAAAADTDSRVREVAVFALGELDTPDSAAALAGILVDEKASEGKRSVAALTALMTEDKAAVATRSAAAAALARASERRGQGPLVLAALSPNPQVRAAAAEALGDLGGGPAQAALSAMIKDSRRLVVAAAARAFASLGPVPSAGADAQASDPWAGLGAMLLDPKGDEDVRIAAAIGMGQSRDPAAAPLLEQIAREPASGHRLRAYAARSLAQLADRAGQPALLRLLEADPPARLIDVPVRYLDLGDDEKTVSYLSEKLTAGTFDEQTLAAERISELDAAGAAGLLAGSFGVLENHVRFSQEWSLVRSQGPAVRRKLIELLQTSRRGGVRMNAALALGGRRDPEAIDALIAACKDERAAVRMAAANSLGRIGDPLAAPALIELLEKDPDLRAAHEALRTLRLREYAGLPLVNEALGRVRGTDRDCGVAGGPDLDGQPANSWVLRKWSQDLRDESIVNLTYESALLWDEANERIVQWGAHGRRADFPQTGMTWIYDVKDNSWRRPEPRREPPGICLTRGMAADPVRGLMYSPAGAGGGHGWVMSLRKNTSYALPWIFDCRSEQWTPAHAFNHPGNCTEGTSCFDLRNDVMLVNSRPLIYDPHVNAWIEPAVSGSPKRVNNAPGAYDPVTGRFLMVADADEAGRARVWAFDLAARRWTELGAANPPPGMAHTPMVYDSANDVFLAFQRDPEARGRTAVWAYHPRENRWEELPPVWPSPCYIQFDVAYDPVRNVAVMSGGWEWGQSCAVTVRETWTYRYKPAARKPAAGSVPGAPRAVRLSSLSDSKAVIEWQPPAEGAPAGYHVWRGVAEQPWAAKYERVTAEPIKEPKLEASERPGADSCACYRVTAVGADGKEGPPSNLVRTKPEVVREVFCARGADGDVRVVWKPSPSPGVVGYNVWRAPTEQPDLWLRTFDPEKNRKAGNDLVKLTAKPVAETEFADRPGDAAIPPATEHQWAPLFAYAVTAVNCLGQESGFSPVTLSIPSPPGPVIAVPVEDGRFLVISGDSGPLTGAERGRWLYRQDCYKGVWAYRSRGAPHPGAVLVDDELWPQGDRRAYFVVPTDASGQLGVPSTEAWAIEEP